MSMGYDWDAESYNRLKLPHARWGGDLLRKVNVRNDAVIVEIGCGPGRDTAKLAGLVPNGRVIAVDKSESMLSVARSALELRFPNVEFKRADVLEDLGMPNQCDLAFSVATFHWVEDHELAFSNVSHVLREGALFLVDCGGKGNIAEVKKAVKSVLGTTESDRLSHFEDVPETDRRLVAAGFEVCDIRLEEDPIRFGSREALKSFMSTVILGAHLKRFDENEREEILEQIAQRVPEMTVDYVRLRIEAVKL